MPSVATTFCKICGGNAVPGTYLKSRVHLHEIELLILVHHELHSPSTDVGHRPCRPHGCLAQFAARLLAQSRRRRLLDDLLVPSLYATVPLEQVHVVAVLIAEHLHLHVARPLDELLDQHGVIVERLLGLALRRIQLLHEFFLGQRNAHALPATATYRLDHHRKTDLAGFLEQPLGRLVFTVIACGSKKQFKDGQIMNNTVSLLSLQDTNNQVPPTGSRIDTGIEPSKTRSQAINLTFNDGHPCLVHDDLGGVLDAHVANGTRRRPNEDHALLSAALGELNVLGEEAIAGMDRLAARCFGGVKDASCVKVTLLRCSRTDAVCLVSLVRNQSRNAELTYILRSILVLIHTALYICIRHQRSNQII